MPKRFNAVSICLFAIAAVCLVAVRAQTPTPGDTVAFYREAARVKYEALVNEIYSSCDEYWMLGHSFDTIVDYMSLTPSKDAHRVMDMVLKQYLSTQGYWYDDFGWWGIASLKASLHPQFKRYSRILRDIALSCWDTMDKNAPNVWKRAEDFPRYVEYAPRMRGGVWNACWDGTPDCNFEGSLKGYPWGNLGGIQNTVTNTLYLVLSARLFLASTDVADVHYFDAADREHGFLSQWFDALPADQALWQALTPDAGLVRERVSTFAKSWINVTGYDPALTWAGDQGLLLGGLEAYMRAAGDGTAAYAAALRRAEQLLAGVPLGLADPAGLLAPWTPGRPPPGDDPHDYMTGPGVFWRYALHAWRHAPALRPALTSAALQGMVASNAAAAAAAAVPPEGAPGCARLVNVTNDLAALTAAIAMLGGT